MNQIIWNAYEKVTYLNTQTGILCSTILWSKGKMSMLPSLLV
jgi:hypothetical protein